VKRVLILTASYGSGHNAAARCLARAFERERCAVTVVDHFGKLVSPLFERASRALYYAMLRRAPLLWSIGYALGDWMASDSPLALGVTRLGARRLAALLESLWPDAVVTTHATPATAMSSLVAQGRRTPPHTSVVTDFVAHSQWIARHIDCYCVAADEVKHEFIARGIPAQRIVVTGMPVREEFAEPVDPAAARAALGLSDRAPVVLAMAGSRGSLGRLPDVARALDAVERPLQGLLVCGHDRYLKRKLERLTDGTRVRTLGYTDDVRRLMVAADLLVTKAGGLTLAEAMAAELPVLAYGSLPGQERRNERFAARAGIGLVPRSYLELVHLLARADPPRAAARRDAAHRRRGARASGAAGAAAVILTRLGLAAAAGWAAYAWGAHLLTLGCVWRGSDASRRVALTFDDGPDPDWTPRVLDLLAERRARASFFLVGERAARAPDTVRRIVSEGHEVASHGWSHRSLWLCGPRRTAEEIGRAHETLAALADRAPRHFRPPWGMVNAAMFGALRRFGERCVFWSIQPEGLRPVAAQDQVSRVLRRAHPGAIVDLHDAEGAARAPERLVQALPAMIDGLRAAGYELATVAELLSSEGASVVRAPPEAHRHPLR